MAAGDGRGRTIPQWLGELADQFGPRTAVVGSGGSLTYAALEAESGRWAEGLLRRGVAKGARIGLWLGNGTEWVLAWAALSRAGAVAVPLSTLFSDAELARVVRHADLHGLICHRSFLGQDVAMRLERAWPGLVGATGPDLSLPEAPYLRWII